MKQQGLSRSPEWYASQMAKIARKEAVLTRITQREQDKQIKQAAKQRFSVYLRTVWDMTKQLPLSELEGFHLRSWKRQHLMYLVSPRKGFRYGIPAEWIASMDNLRIYTVKADGTIEKPHADHFLALMLQRLKQG